MYGFFPEMPVQDVNKISMLGLAHVGDAVYELLYRSKLCTDGHTAVAEMHRMTVAFVRAEAQAEAAAKLLPVLTQDETSVFKRGRNAKVNSVPHNADIGQYHAATGLEALFGWLYLRDDHARINELFNRMMEDDNAT